MAFEFEALVGHLYIVGGRTISSPPPGAFVEVAPKKAARGRETDTFFTLVLPSGDTIAPSIFYENMASLAAEKYFDSGGSVTAGLKEMVQHINANLYDHNQRDPRRYEASMLAGVLRGTDLIIARVGAGVALYRHKGETQAFPDNFDNDEALFSAPLGVQPIADVKMARYDVANGSRLVMADALLADLDFNRVVTALSGADIGEALVSLKAVSGNTITLTLIEFVPPDQPSPLPIREAESTALPGGARVTATEEIPAAPAEAASSAPAPRREPRPSTVDRALGSAARGTAKVLDGAGGMLDRAAPAQADGGDDRRGFFNTPWATGLSLLIPVLVVVLVVILWIGGTGESEFDICVGDAQRGAQTARGVASSDVTGTLAAWNALTLVLERCEGIRTADPQISALRRESREIIDNLLNISRRTMTPIDALPSARLTRGFLQGEDMYVLDDANDQVYRLTLTVEGMGMVQGTRQPIPSMRRNAPIAQFTVGDIIDIAWAEDGSGLSQGNVVAALDRNGVLIDCPPRTLQNCSAQRIITDTWVNPVAITFWSGRLYVLDPPANQIWRYDPSGGAFPNAPTEYFTGENRPDIRGAVDFGIDTPGSIYVLVDNGTLGRFTSARQDGFAFSGFPENLPLTRPIQFSLNPNPPRQGMYFADISSRTIFETTMAGTFVNSYRATDDSLFAELADVVVDTNKQIIYALSGNSILAFRRNEGSQP